MTHSLYVRPEEERRVRHIMAAREWHLRPVVREALNLGLLMMLAGTPTDEHGRYADLTSKELAERLQPFTLQILELLHQEGCLPALLTYLSPASHAAPSGPSPFRAHAPLPAPLPQNGANGTPAEGHDGNDGTGDDDLLAELLEAGCLLVDD
jgi:hypothetical protein